MLDAGCGDGRNLIWLLQHGFECYGVDARTIGDRPRSPDRVPAAPTLPSTNFTVADLTRLPSSGRAWTL